MYKYPSILLFIIMNTGFIFSQKITITDHTTGKPIESVLITDISGTLQVTTDQDGIADISKYSRTSSFFISMPGYLSAELTYSMLEAENFMVEMLPTQVQLDQVVVSASRWRQTNKNIPMRVSSLSQRDIAFYSPQTAADLLGYSGRVFIQKSQQGGGSPMIRGFATNRLIYAIDGVRMNTAIFRAGNIQNVISLDAFAIENAEVLFGPGSVMYGSDAIGGVMAFQTLTPRYGSTNQSEFSGSATLRYATANQEKTGHLHFNLGRHKWSSLTSLSYNDFGDLRMGSDGPKEYLKIWNVRREGTKDVAYKNPDSLVQTPSGYTQYNLMQKIRFRATDNIDLQYAFHLSATSEYARYDRHIRLRNGLPRHAEWNYGPQKWMMHQLTGTFSKKSSWYDQMIWRLAFQDFEESRIDRDMNKPTRSLRYEEVTAWSANVDLIKKLSDSSNLSYGVEAVINDVKSTGVDQDIIKGTSVQGPSRYPQALWSSYAGFVGYDHRVSEKLNIQAGARYSLYSLKAEYESTFFPFPFSESNFRNGALTGSIGMVFRPSQKTTFRTNLSTGFRSPNVDDSGKVFESAVGAVIVPNPDLESEYAYNVDIGLVQLIGDRVRLDATAFYTYLDDALVKRDFQLNGKDSIVYNGQLSRVEAIQNAANAKVKGVQLGIEIKMGYGLSIYSQYNIQKGEEELDNGKISPSRHAAPNFGNTSLTWSTKNLSFSLSAVYSEGKSFDQLPAEEQNKPEIYAIDENKKPYSPSWMTFNFRTQYHLGNLITLHVAMENITDIRYRPYSSGLVAPGRNLMMSASVKF